jgi:SAM-dependent methyltransferase
VSPSRFSDYDSLAWLYDRHWGSAFADRALPILDRLVLDGLPAGSRLLDLCCGTGHLAGVLSRRGFVVTGLDGSAEMLKLARQRVSPVEWVLADARSFGLSGVYDAALCLFDSLNHVMQAEELLAVFRHVFQVLRPGGSFLFDLNMDEGYRARWQGSISGVEADHVFVARALYDAAARVGRFDVTTFVDRGGWQRTDLTFTQRCYPESEIRSALDAAGFGATRAYDAARELGLTDDVGRTFFLSRRP